jgi:hypothetical protein
MRSKLLISILALSSLTGITTGSAHADTYSRTYSNITYGTFTDESGYYIAGKDGDTYEFIGSFSLTQTVLGSPDGAAPWTSPFATLTVAGNHVSIAYDITVTIPTKGYTAWISLSEFTQDGLEICTRTPSGGGSTGGGETGGTGTAATIESRTRTLYTASGSPHAVIVHL